MGNEQALAAMVLRIEKSSIHDGEGLRTVVFLKGCNLRCRWCSTPESQAMPEELGFEAVRCQDCGHCLDVCPEGARQRRADGFILTDKARCRHCLRCHDACPHQAIVSYGRRMSVDEVLDEVLKDEVFYFHSGGGLTVSGGEPLLQAAFVAELMKGCRRHGVGTALETCFGVPWPQIELVLPYLDTLFVDLKHRDSAEHQNLTGVGNEDILANIMRADALPQRFDIIVRVPLIPGLNDGEDNLRRTAEFAAALNKIKGLQLLPYHRLGSGAYAKLGRDYELKDLPLPSTADVRGKYEQIRLFAPGLTLI